MNPDHAAKCDALTRSLRAAGTPVRLGKDTSNLFRDRAGGARRRLDIFLDPENNQLSIGYDEEKDQVVGYHYGLLATEARATSFYAIGKGNLPKSHWWLRLCM